MQPWGPAVLEEALESIGSGVEIVGKGDYIRQTRHGNKQLSKVGESSIFLVLEDQCYGLNYTNGSLNLHEWINENFG